MYKNIQNIKFLDFCAGIGGGRIALENLGMTCLGFSEIDKGRRDNLPRVFQKR